MQNPIIQRELVTVLRTRRALAMQLLPALVFALLVIVRWPTDARVAQSGVQALDVFRLFGYGLLATLLVLVPAYPATTIVREKRSGTLALLLNSPMSSLSIYFGKLAGVLGFALLPLVMSLPAAAACYAMGGISLVGGVLALYLLLLLVVLQYSTLALLVSTRASTTDGAMRVTYALVLLLAVVSLGPNEFLRGREMDLGEAFGALFTGDLAPILSIAGNWLQCLSPIPAVMEVVGHAGLNSQGLLNQSPVLTRYILLALLTTAGFMIWTIAGLKQTMFDRPRAQGVITDDRGLSARSFRRMFYLVDPQRRKKSIGALTNPVMIKEFRSRRFGRSHWMLRLVATCAVVSLLLTLAATMGTLDWGVETIGGIMVMLQVALIVLITPSLAAGLFSSEHETGGWTLLRMTPLSAGRIVRGKLISVVWTLLLVLFATLPGYAVMIFIKPVLTQQVIYVLASLVLTAVFALVVSATVSSFFRRTAPATVTAYAVLSTIVGGTMLIWLGRGAPFGHRAVEMALVINPMAAALSVLKVPGFAEYNLVPANWWFIAGACAACLAVLSIQTWRLVRPQ
jgi:ABC-type transport system involved in multi-copper enzyme maturation permease subunit